VGAQPRAGKVWLGGVGQGASKTSMPRSAATVEVAQRDGVGQPGRRSRTTLREGWLLLVASQCGAELQRSDGAGPGYRGPGRRGVRALGRACAAWPIITYTAHTSPWAPGRDCRPLFRLASEAIESSKLFRCTNLPRLLAARSLTKSAACRRPITVRRASNAEAASLCVRSPHIGPSPADSAQILAAVVALISTVFSQRWFPPTFLLSSPRQPWACASLVWGGPGPGRAAPDPLPQQSAAQLIRAGY